MNSLSRYAAIQLKNGDEIEHAVNRLLSELETRESLAVAARALALEKRHVLDKVMEALEPWLQSRRMPRRTWRDETDECMKAPAFWYQIALGIVTAVLLSPLSLLWRVGTAIRRAVTTPYHAKVPVICIGNIVAGGAGKTPTAIIFAQMLSENGQKPVFVDARLWRRRTHGPVRVDLKRHTAVDVGDEALLLGTRCADMGWAQSRCRHSRSRKTRYTYYS